MSHAPSETLSLRHERLRRELAIRGLDALVVTSLPNICYLTNFTGSSAIVVAGAGRLQFLTDFRYVAAVEESRGHAHECPGLALVKVDNSYDATLVDALTGMPGARVGFEAANLTVSRHEGLLGKLTGETAPRLVQTVNLVEGLRAVKDAYELATLREAAARLSGAVMGAISEARRGRTEFEVAHAIDERLRAAGFERPAFDTIVASGANAALPHARPGKRILCEDDLVVLDFGGVYDSYCVDLTRTVSVGRATSRAKDVHEAVRAAHDAAIRTVAPGRFTFEIDRAARQVLEGRGMADAFGHGTGHGLGIEVHEEPRISRRRPDEAEPQAVQPGMVFTIEPGAYFPGWGGVRIEDDVVVTEGGVDVLTEVTTELVET